MIRFNCPHCGRTYELPDALASLPLVCKQCGQRITPPAPSPDPPPPRPVAPVPPPPAPVAVPKPAAAPAPAPKIASAPKPNSAPVAAPVKSPPLPAPASAQVKPVKSVEPPAPTSAKLSAAPPAEPAKNDVLVARPDSTPGSDFNTGGTTVASPSANGTHPTSPTDLGGVNEAVDSIADVNLDLLGPVLPAPPPKPAPLPPPPEPPAEETSEPTLLPFLVDLGAFVLLVIGGLFLGEFLVRKPMGQVLSESGSAAKFPPIDLLLLVGPAVMFGLIYLLLNSRQRTLGAWLRRRRGAAAP